MTPLERLLELAAAMKECPKCQGYDASLRSQGLTTNPRNGRPLCSYCDPRGGAPVFPMLRRECGHSYGAGILYSLKHCPFCQGRGWVVVDSLEAILEAIGGDVKFVKRGRGWACQIGGEKWADWYNYPKEAAAQALWKAWKEENNV